MNVRVLKLNSNRQLFQLSLPQSFIYSLVAMIAVQVIDASFFSNAAAPIATTTTVFDSVIYLKTGVALSLVFCFGIAACPAIFLSALALLLFPYSEPVSIKYLLFTLLEGLAITLQSYVIVQSFQRSAEQGNPLSSSKVLILFISLSALISIIVSVLLNINHSVFTDSSPSSTAILSTFFENMTSLMVIPNLLFAWRNHSVRVKQNTHPLEWFVWISSAVLASYFSSRSEYSFVLFSIPILMWASTRFNQFTCCITLLLSYLFILAELQATISESSIEYFSNYMLQIIWLLLVVTTLYFSTLRSDQRKIEVQLEEMVEQRTQELLGANQELRDEVFIREQAEKSLRNTSKRYKALFETAGIPIIVLDSQFRIKQWNNAAEMQFAYTKEQVFGNNFIDLFIPKSIQDETAWKFTKVLESGMNKENMESEVISYDGLSHTMLWNMNHFSDQNDQHKQNQLLLIGQNISEIRKTQNQLHYLAHFDALTDTANRRLFEDRCAQAIQSSVRHKHPIALIGLDIDHFKRINDTLGHDIGDQFLVTLAKRLKQSIRKEDTLARLGGDEFAILLASVSGREGAETVARNILENITQPVTIKGNELLVTSSIGITLCPNDGIQYPDLLKNADMAMYRAKNAGRNNIQFYSPEMNEEMLRQHVIEQELRIAFQENQFNLHYQPIIDIETGEVLALEALLRWKHPEKGIITPDYFLDIAEQTGQLHEIGEWVVRNACLQGRAIHQWSKTPIQLALNLSSRQFNHPRLLDMLTEIINETQFDPRNLILEMSENTITSNIEASHLTLSKLHDLGISLTIDSFGTGLSSLRQLKQIPIDIIKIDRTFVNGIPNDESDMAITETLLAIANQMDLKTFATGVETPAQEAFLKINGCRYAQGYLYSAPVPFIMLPQLFERIQSGQNLAQGEQIFFPFEKKKL